MTATNQPFGLLPVGHQFGGDARYVELDNFITSGYASSIALGSPIKIVNGVVQIAAANEDILGVFAGCEYLRTGDSIKSTGYWPASTSYVTGSMRVYAYTDPGIVYEIQASGPLAQTSVGQQADLNNPGTLNTVTGRSTARISTTLTTTTNTGQLRIVNLSKRTDNAWGDAFTVVQVQIARSQLLASKPTII